MSEAGNIQFQKVGDNRETQIRRGRLFSPFAAMIVLLTWGGLLSSSDSADHVARDAFVPKLRRSAAMAELIALPFVCSGLFCICHTISSPATIDDTFIYQLLSINHDSVCSVERIGERYALRTV